MKDYISATSSKGMPQAFNTIPHTSLPLSLEKFAFPKKIPSK
jgi:glucan phosphorylase